MTQISTAPADVAQLLEALQVLLLANRRAPTVTQLRHYLASEDLELAEDVVRDAVTCGDARHIEVDGVVRLWHRGAVSLPDGASNRQAVLALVRHAVAVHGRAVRHADVEVVAEAERADDAGSVIPTRVMLTRGLASLVRTKSLVVVAEVLGGTGKAGGRNLMLPADMIDSVAQQPAAPLTWYEYVVSVFQLLWIARIETAHAQGTCPAAISTCEVRSALANDRTANGVPVVTERWGVSLEDPQVVVNVLAALAKGRNPRIKAVVGRRALWMPADCDPQVVVDDLASAKNIDRAVEATRRAMRRLGQPAVALEHVAAECDLDPALRVSGRGAMARVLSEAARGRLGGTGGKRVPRRVRHLIRVGRPGGAAYYTAPREDRYDDDVRRATTFVICHGVIERAMGMNLMAEFVAASKARSPLLALGRMRLIVTRADAITRDLAEARASAAPDHMAFIAECDELLALTGKARADAIGWARFHASAPETPEGVRSNGLTLSTEGLRELFAPFSQTVRNLQRASELVPRFARMIRRVKNPDFAGRQQHDKRLATEWWFDRTDALLYAAKQWGGIRVRLNAILAETELGQLRDARFAVASLKTKVPDVRMRAIAALAFLQPANCGELIADHARNDADPGVRETALWAAGFVGWPGANDLLLDAEKRDELPRVRSAARVMRATGEAWWWK
ncbi:MAG: HEAT repeat domain-containing protein [Gemmatimonadaceae bacterium]